MAKSISPNLPRRRSRPRGQNAPAWMLVQVFAAGVGLCLLLLALAAFLLTHTPLPLHLVQPMACLAASAGAAVSGFLLAVLRAVEATLRRAIHRRRQAETVGKEAEA